jgi:hypothetical protein
MANDSTRLAGKNCEGSRPQGLPSALTKAAMEKSSVDPLITITIRSPEVMRAGG